MFVEAVERGGHGADVDWIDCVTPRTLTEYRSVCAANRRISFTMTANPLPDAPALDASIYAFKASRFVCDAISLMPSVNR